MKENLNFNLLKQDVEKEIREKGFENLYYALFDEYSSQLWAIHLYYRDGKFMVSSRDDRTYIMGKTWEFDNFEEAKLLFLKKMESFIEMNRYLVQNGDSPYYSCSLWDKYGGQEKMRDEDKERLELISIIQDLGYESLRYSIFNEYGPGEWEVVIDFDDSMQVYNVYATMDRASYNKKLEFDNFEAAKNKFLEKLDLTVEINKLFVENGESPEYSSPLWDKEETD